MAEEVKVTQRTESHVVIEGLGEGVEVAMISPAEKKGKSVLPVRQS